MAEKEYIEREAAYQTLTEYYHHTTEGMHSALREAISRVPAADVRPVARATNKSKSGFLCSACSFGDFGGFHGYKPNFCPNCGADMREPPKEET